MACPEGLEPAFYGVFIGILSLCDAVVTPY